VTTALYYFDFLTAATWFVLSVVGIVLRIRRTRALRRIVLPAPVDPKDAEYLASVKRSTYLRLFVKAVFLVGSLIALFHLPLFGAWRLLVIAALAAMIYETVGVDRIRARLGQGPEGAP